MDNDKNKINNDMPRLDVSLIPEHVKTYLAETIMDMYNNFLKKPGGRERLEAEKRRLGLVDDNDKEL